ncbi:MULTISPECIES: cell wall biosynthesis glycosyltransferase [Phenylobacterium]|uniref:MobA-like NTP transferase domain-containing protein n=1 Tax=Phenylobacterium koreense TaxID=266125 RepID=A0ABV2ED44_9CAUL
MISTIILAGGADRDLASLLSALVPAAVDGLVRDVVVVAGTPDQATVAICEDAGAELSSDLSAAVARARSELLLVAPEDLRLRPGWHESVRRHLEGRGGRALVCEADAGLLARLMPPRRAGILVEKTRFEEIAPVSLEVLRRGLGSAPRLS